MSTVTRRLVSSSALLTLLLLTAVPADAATLGRGMDQLVRLHETNNPKLAAALNAHLRNSTGAVLVHVRLDPDASSAQVLEALRRDGFVLQAISLLDPTLVEGYLPLSAARAAAAVPGVRRVLAVQRPRASPASCRARRSRCRRPTAVHARGIDGKGTRSACCPTASTSTARRPPPRRRRRRRERRSAAGRGRPRRPVAPGRHRFGRPTKDARCCSSCTTSRPAPSSDSPPPSTDEVYFSNNILALRSQLPRRRDRRRRGLLRRADVLRRAARARRCQGRRRQGAAYFSSAGNNGLEAYEDFYDPVLAGAGAESWSRPGKENIDLDSLAAASACRPRASTTSATATAASASRSAFTSYFGDDDLTSSGTSRSTSAR